MMLIKFMQLLLLLLLHGGPGIRTSLRAGFRTEGARLCVQQRGQRYTLANRLLAAAVGNKSFAFVRRPNGD